MARPSYRANYDVRMPRITITLTHPVGISAKYDAIFFKELHDRAISWQRVMRAFIERTHETWNESDDIPNWKLGAATFDGKSIIAEVTADPKQDWGAFIWGLLNGGTKERWAVMTEDFVPKTSPETWDPDPGQGGLAFVLSKKKAQQKPKGLKPGEVWEEIKAHKGIERRNWTGMFEEYWNEDYKKLIEADVKEAMSKLTDRINRAVASSVKEKVIVDVPAAAGILDAAFYKSAFERVKGKTWDEVKRLVDYL